MVLIFLILLNVVDPVSVDSLDVAVVAVVVAVFDADVDLVVAVAAVVIVAVAVTIVVAVAVVVIVAVDSLDVAVVIPWTFIGEIAEDLIFVFL